MNRTLALVVLALTACETTSTPSAEASAPNTTVAHTSSAGGGAPGATDPSAVIATWEGGQLTYGDVLERGGNELTKLEIEYLSNRYDTESMVLDSLVVEQLFEAEVAARGLDDIAALLTAEIEAKVTPPTDEEVEAVYPMMARRLRGASLEEARPAIAADLLRRKQAERYGAYVDELRAKAGVTTSLPFPDLPRIDIPIAEADPVMGPADAKVTIVQFAEYQCPYCERALPTLDEVFETYGDDVRMVFKDFPLNFHANARGAAIAAHCAGEQDAYWTYHRTLLENQRALERADLIRHAKTHELDPATFEQCLDSGKYDAVIDASMEVGQSVGVSGTPAFFVNGIFLSGAQPFDKFAAIIDRELAVQ